MVGDKSIIISIEEYKELLITSGKYEQLIEQNTYKTFNERRVAYGLSPIENKTKEELIKEINQYRKSLEKIKNINVLHLNESVEVIPYDIRTNHKFR